VQVVIGTCHTGVRVGFSACHTWCVSGMQYYVCALCSHGIVTYAFIVLHSRHIFVLCCTLGVGVCILLCIGCRHMYCIVYTSCRCMCCMLGVSACIAWICMSCVVVCV